MSRNSRPDQDAPSPFDQAGANVIPTNVREEIETSFLEYAYSVIHSRALPDARDGLKPVHRRILYSMHDDGLRPNAPYVKSARVVGSTMGRFHPHGDAAIYDAMVRLAQDFSLNTPFVDGQGNFGSPNDSAAAARYTEARLAPVATALVNEIDEDTVDFGLNYDGSLPEPSVLPAGFPNLLVNGTTGIAVGMATNMIPHNLAEAIAAARVLLKDPDASLDKLMKVLPGPDLPTGGSILGMDQVRAAYETGRGTVKMRAKANVEPLEGSRGRSAIIVTELPYGVGTEKVIEVVKAEIAKKRLGGIADIKDLSDRMHGTRLVIECKSGVNPQALLAELWKYTPLEQSFGMNNLALVDGQPQTLGLRELLQVFLDHRLDVVTRRTEFRLRKAEARKHIVEGLLIALDAIDRVVKLIRSSKDTAAARAGLMKTFKLSDIQAGHILDTPLRRLVSLEVDALREELAELNKAISGYNAILNDETELRKIVDKELSVVASEYGRPRRTVLVEGELAEVLAASAPTVALEIADDPCEVLLSATGLLARTPAASEDAKTGSRRSGRTKHDAVTAKISSTARGQVLAVTNRGRAFKVDTLTFPSVPDAPGTVSLRGGIQAAEAVPLQPGERVIGLAPLTDTKSPGLAIGTRQGVVKICAPDWPVRGNEFDIMSLKPGDEIVHASWLSPDAPEDIVFITSDAQLLRFPAKSVRPQGRSGGGMAGIKLASGQTVVAFGAVPTTAEVMVATWTGVSMKVTPLDVYPGKGRGTGGVRAHRFLKGESEVALAFVGTDPVGTTDKGDPIVLPDVDSRRDGSGTALEVAPVAFGSQQTR